MAPAWKIRYSVSENGTRPFEDFIRRLKTREERADCAAWIALLRLRGNTLRGDCHLTHTNGLREIHDRSMRIFYVCKDDDVIIIDGLLPEQGKEFFDDIARKARDLCQP